MNKQELEQHIKQGATLANLALTYNVSESTVRYWLTKYSLKTQRARDARWQDIENLRAVVSRSVSKREVLLGLGMRDTGSIYTTLENVCKEHNIELPQFVTNGRSARRLANEQIFVLGRPSKGFTLKSRLIADFGYRDECALCGLGPIWNGLAIVLEMDHINGNHTDNRIENLRILCPNCHSQQSTNSRKKSASLTPLATNE